MAAPSSTATAKEWDSFFSSLLKRQKANILDWFHLQVGIGMSDDSHAMYRVIRRWARDSFFLQLGLSRARPRRALITTMPRRDVLGSWKF